MEDSLTFRMSTEKCELGNKHTIAIDRINYHEKTVFVKVSCCHCIRHAIEVYDA